MPWLGQRQSDVNPGRWTFTGKETIGTGNRRHDLLSRLTVDRLIFEEVVSNPSNYVGDGDWGTAAIGALTTPQDMSRAPFFEERLCKLEPIPLPIARFDENSCPPGPIEPIEIQAEER